MEAVDKPTTGLKRGVLVFYGVIGLAAAYLCIVTPMQKNWQKRHRGELHLLNTLQGELENHLAMGGTMPTNWLSLSNAVDYELLSKICETAGLDPLQDLYTVLPHPIDMDPIHRSIFLVRSKPCLGESHQRGRWLVGVGFNWRPPDLSNVDSNRPGRTFVPEKYLPDRIRTQLAGISKN